MCVACPWARVTDRRLARQPAAEYNHELEVGINPGRGMHEAVPVWHHFFDAQRARGWCAILSGGLFSTHFVVLPLSKGHAIQRLSWILTIVRIYPHTPGERVADFAKSAAAIVLRNARH